MAEHGEPLRKWARRAPAHPVRVAAESEAIAGAAGEALNLSDGGACLALQTGDLGVGDEVILWLTFAGPGWPVPATGRIVWTSGGRGRPRYGVEWTHEGPQRSWIGWLAGV
ncbi:MAG TPA: PilZ domain-containing protein [Vicinamibacteria bacterium]|nr:PilZ domain-containing protein [Vicinamibacteria bacterium]